MGRAPKGVSPVENLVLITSNPREFCRTESRGHARLMRLFLEISDGQLQLLKGNPRKYTTWFCLVDRKPIPDQMLVTLLII